MRVVEDVVGPVRTWILVLGLFVSGCLVQESPEATPSPSTPAPSSSGSASSTASASGTTTASTTTTSCSAGRCSCPYLDGCGIPGSDADADDQFELNDSYPAGSILKWVVRNDGAVDYAAKYPAWCSIEVYTQEGRRVWMTSCRTDVLGSVRIEAGNTTDLGSWNTSECVRDHDQWYASGCAEWKPLSPGTYAVRRTFCLYVPEASYKEDCSAVSRSGATLTIA